MTQRADGFEEFFRLEYPRLLRVSIALTGDRSLAEDLTQEALLRTHLAWSNVAHLDKPGAWSRHVLMNLARDSFRKAKRRRGHVDDRAAAAQQPELPAEEVWRAVRALPRLQRAVVALHYVDDLSIEAVAAVMGVTAGSVKSSLSRARQALARQLEKEHR